MNTARRIAKNAAVSYAAQIIVTLLSLILSIYMARKLGSDVFGKYSFAAGFTALFAVFLDLGFGTLIVREVARDKSQAAKYAGNIMVIRTVLAFAFLLLMAVIITLMDYPRDTFLAVLILGISLSFNAFSGIFMQTFQAFERMEYNAFVSVTGQLVTVALGLAAVFLGYGLIGVVSAFAIGNLVRFVVSLLISSSRFAKPRIEIDISFWKSAAKSALPLGLLPIAATISTRADTIMLSVMKGDAAVGWYNAANNLVLGLHDIPWLLMSVVLPVMSASFVSSPSSLRTIYEKSSRLLLFLGVPMAAGLSLLSDRIVLFLYGAEFAPSVGALRILSWSLLLVFLAHPLYFTLVSMNRQNQAAVVVGFSAALNVLLNLILIPSLSYVGAAIAALTSGVVTTVLYFFLVSKRLHVPPLHKVAIKPLIACLAMGVLVYLGNAINLFLLIGLAAVLYFVVLWLLKAFPQEDLNLVKEIIRIPKPGLRSTKRRPDQ